MKAVFIRHAAAQQASELGDAGRKLTKEGKAQAKATAWALKALDIDVEMILASPLRRAVETARLVAAVHGVGAVEQEDALAPPGDAKTILKRLKELHRQGRNAVALVGHAPSLDQVLSLAAAGVEDIGVSLSKAGAACVLLGDAPARLLWVMHRDQLKRLAGT